jgi:transposase
MHRTTYAVDLAKSVFQVYSVDPETGEIHNKQLKRSQILEFFAKRVPALVVLEACGSAHYWARKLLALGHEVRLLHAKYVRPFVRTNKTDRSDAQALWSAAQQPDMRSVAVKSEDQQAVLALHRMRQQLVKFRTMQMNQLRGLLYEFGVALPKGREAGLAELRKRSAELEETVPAIVRQAIAGQLERLQRLEGDIAELERSIAVWHRHHEPSLRLAEAAGIGVLSATALVATMGDPKAFRSGRQFAAFLGLVPTQTGTGGTVRLGPMSKRGDPYMRNLMIMGARGILAHESRQTPWAQELLKRRPFNVAVVALANKTARIAWAMLAHGRDYDPSYISARPA